jgi:RNA polymerase sigma-70 factor (ECF subfamily)
VELERIRSGDSEALGLLLRETWAPLVRYLLTFLDSVEAAEDAAQEAFVRLWEHRERWESGSGRAVVFRIGRNVALDLRRAPSSLPVSVKPWRVCPRIAGRYSS